MKEYIVHYTNNSPITEEAWNNMKTAFGEPIKELVRCKDCKWYEADHRFCHKTKSVTLTSNWDIEIYHKTSPEGFCEKAERIQHD